MEPEAQRAFAEMTRLGRRRDRQSGREAHGRPLLAARAGARADHGAARRRSTARNAAIKAFVAEVHAAGKFSDILLIGIGGSALGPQFISRRARDERRSDAPALFRQHRSRRHRPRAQRLAASAGAHARGGDLQIRRHHGDAQRDARSRSCLHARGARFRQARGGRHRRWTASWTKSRWPKSWLDALPDVGLGRRPHLGDERRGPRAAALQGIDIDGMLAGAAAMDEWTRTAETLQKPRHAAGADVALRRRRSAARRTWWCCPTRTGSCSSRNTSSSS